MSQSVGEVRDHLAELGRRSRRRHATVYLATLVVVLVVVVITLSTGDLPVSLGQLVQVAIGKGDEASRLVLIDFRLPRLLMALVAGFALGCGGILFQTVLRNPLASPDIIGVVTGASLGAVTVLLVLGSTGLSVGMGALVGGIAMAALNVILAWRSGMTGYRFVLCGIGLSFLASGFLGYALTRANVREAQVAVAWLAGSVSAADYGAVVQVGIVVAVALPLMVFTGRRLAIMELGDDVATSLGLRTSSFRMATIGLGTVVVAFAVAAAGPIAFVSLMAGPVARRLVGGAAVPVVLAGLTGALWTALGDLIGQHLIPSTPVPVGVITGLLAAPYLFWMLSGVTRSRKVG